LVGVKLRAMENELGPELKRCVRCCVEKPLECYSTDNKRKDGKYVYCKDCVKLFRPLAAMRDLDRIAAALTKVCSACKAGKPLDQFRPRGDGKGLDGLKSICKSCERDKNRKHNQTALRSGSRAANIMRNALHLRAYLLEHPCIDCGESDPIVLDFDHVRGEKKFNVSSGVRRMFSIAVLDEEIAKCEVRCANCHRKQTAKRGGWYPWLMEQADDESVA
jgi:hypothetical protein